MNFTPQQQHSLLSKMGYSGPVDSRMMEQFIQSNPGAAAKMGKFDRAMKRGFQTGGLSQSKDASDPFSSLRNALKSTSPTPQTTSQSKDASDPFSSLRNALLRNAIKSSSPNFPGYTPWNYKFPNPPKTTSTEPPVESTPSGVLKKPTGITSATSQAKDTYSEAIDKLVKAERKAAAWSIAGIETKETSPAPTQPSPAPTQPSPAPTQPARSASQQRAYDLLNPADKAIVDSQFGGNVPGYMFPGGDR